MNIENTGHRSNSRQSDDLISSEKLLSQGFKCLIESQNHGGAYYLPSFLTKEVSLDLLNQILERLTWTQESITLFGRSVLQPRLTAWIGKGLSAESC